MTVNAAMRPVQVGLLKLFQDKYSLRWPFHKVGCSFMSHESGFPSFLADQQRSFHTLTCRPACVVQESAGAFSLHFVVHCPSTSHCFASASESVGLVSTNAGESGASICE